MSTQPITFRTARPDLVATESAPRPTAPPLRVNFKQALANAASMAGRTAEAAVTALPGGTMLSTALRGPAVDFVPGPMATSSGVASGALSSSAALTSPEGPGAASGANPAFGGAGDPQAALAQAQTNEMQMLVLQQQVSAQQNSFTTMSNILKSESDTERTAINNIK